MSGCSECAFGKVAGCWRCGAWALPTTPKRDDEPRCKFCGERDSGWLRTDLERGWRIRDGSTDFHCRAGYHQTT